MARTFRGETMPWRRNMAKDRSLCEVLFNSSDLARRSSQPGPRTPSCSCCGAPSTREGDTCARPWRTANLSRREGEAHLCSGQPVGAAGRTEWGRGMSALSQGAGGERPCLAAAHLPADRHGPVMAARRERAPSRSRPPRVGCTASGAPARHSVSGAACPVEHSLPVRRGVPRRALLAGPARCAPPSAPCQLRRCLPHSTLPVHPALPVSSARPASSHAARRVKAIDELAARVFSGHLPV